MSIHGRLVQLSHQQIDALADDPATITQLIDTQPTFALGKLWAGLAWLLRPLELDEAVLGGIHELRLSDDPFDRANLLRPREVGPLARQLARLDGAAVRAAFDADAMARAQVYPESIWHEPGSAHELFLRFVDLVAFYEAAARRSCGVVAYRR